MAATIRQGFLLTRHWRDTDAGLDITLWLTTPDGAVEMVFPGQAPVFFLSRAQADSAGDVLAGAELRPLQLHTFGFEPVVGCYFATQQELVRARRSLEERGLQPLEADLRPVDRFLMERFVRGGVRFAGGEQLPAGNGRCPCLANPRLAPGDWRPALRVVSLDIETAVDSPTLYSIGLRSDDVRRVLMVGEGEDDELLRYYRSEAELLQAFLQWVADYDPDVFIGWNVVGFDFWFLAQCCRRLHIPFRLGRDGTPADWRELDDGSERRVLSLRGRVVLDGIDVLKTAGYQMESYSLQAVATGLLGEGKLLAGSDRGQEITRLYQQDKAALARYNIQDCQLVLDIFRRQRLLEFCIARSQLTGLPLDRIGGSVAAFDHQYLPLLHRQGFVAPARGSVQPQGSPGGYVLSSRPGLFRHVLVLDFKSLYPSIIRSFCIDPMGLAIADASADEDTVPGFLGARFSRRRHLLPDIIARLWAERDAARRGGDAVLAQAIKIMMNSFYGVLGTPGCRFFDPRLASSITMRGHQIITESRDYIERSGYQVIYGDTDSVFVLVPECEDSERARAAGRALQQDLNAWWRQRLAEEMGLESVLEIQFETHFERFFMPTIRGSEQGSKKRYAGLVRDGDQVRVVFKGLENVRSDWTALARHFQQELFTRIFTDQPWQDYLAEVVDGLYAGVFDTQLVYRKRLRQSLADYQRNVPPHVQAARKALARGAHPDSCRRGEWMEYVITVNGPEPATAPGAPLDYDHYRDRQLAPVADSILHFFGTSLEQQVARQIPMF